MSIAASGDHSMSLAVAVTLISLAIVLGAIALEAFLYIAGWDGTE